MNSNDETEAEIERLEAERARKKAARADASKLQYLEDLKALSALEEDDPDATFGVVKLPTFIPGLPTRVFVRTPTSSEYKRLNEKIRKAHAKSDVDGVTKAQEELARCCWVYPKGDDLRKAVLEAAPGALNAVVVVASRLAEGRAEDEGKD